MSPDTQNDQTAGTLEGRPVPAVALWLKVLLVVLVATGGAVILSWLAVFRASREAAAPVQAATPAKTIRQPHSTGYLPPAFTSTEKPKPEAALRDPDPPTYMPGENTILFDVMSHRSGMSSLHIENGTDQNAIAKLIDTRSDSKACSFIIRARTTAVLDRIEDGEYRLLFVYGDRIITDTDRFLSPQNYTEIKDVFSFRTTIAANRYHYSKHTVTLQPVLNGNARTAKIRAEEFDKY